MLATASKMYTQLAIDVAKPQEGRFDSIAANMAEPCSFACTSDCHSFNLSACHKKTVNSGQIHKALSHIDPYGALFSRIGKAIDPGLSTAANILLSVPRPWSIVFF